MRLVYCAAVLALGGCSLVSSPAYVYRGTSPQVRMTAGLQQRGVASWYGLPFHGRTTANGETYDMNALTAAHRTLPFGTVLQVTSLDNGRTVTVRVNDRGPYVSGRIIDLSRGAADRLGMIESGIANVSIKVVGNE